MPLAHPPLWTFQRHRTTNSMVARPTLNRHYCTTHLGDFGESLLALVYKKLGPVNQVCVDLTQRRKQKYTISNLYTILALWLTDCQLIAEKVHLDHLQSVKVNSWVNTNLFQCCLIVFWELDSLPHSCGLVGPLNGLHVQIHQTCTWHNVKFEL